MEVLTVLLLVTWAVAALVVPLYLQGRTLPLSQTLALFDVHKLILMLILDLEYGDVL